MKKLSVLVGLVLLLSQTKAFSATTQPQAIGLVTAIIESKTIAQINLLAPKSAGQLVYCSNCVQSAICVSSGTAAGAWTVTSATSTIAVGGLLGHCQ